MNQPLFSLGSYASNDLPSFSTNQKTRHPHFQIFSIENRNLRLNRAAVTGIQYLLTSQAFLMWICRCTLLLLCSDDAGGQQSYSSLICLQQNHHMLPFSLPSLAYNDNSSSNSLSLFSPCNLLQLMDLLVLASGVLVYERSRQSLSLVLLPS